MKNLLILIALFTACEKEPVNTENEISNTEWERMTEVSKHTLSFASESVSMQVQYLQHVKFDYSLDVPYIFENDTLTITLDDASRTGVMRNDTLYLNSGIYFTRK